MVEEYIDELYVSYISVEVTGGMVCLHEEQTFYITEAPKVLKKQMETIMLHKLQDTSVYSIQNRP
jgi:transposase